MKTAYLNLLHKHLGLILLVIFIIIALFSFDEYGMSIDEEMMRYSGLVSFNYVFSGDQTLDEWEDRDHGVAFELPLILMEKTFNLRDTRDIFLARHLATHLFFLLGAFFFFKLVDFLYKNKLLATIGFLMFVLNPSLYGHSFFNSKDIPFMAMFAICLYIIAVSFRKKTINNFILLGISIGLLINIRIMGILLPFCILLFLIIDAFKDKKYNFHFKLGLLFFFSMIITLYTSWPYLWLDPINNFISVFESMSKYRWPGEVLFRGQFIKATELSWNYIPVWFLITTPIFYIISGIFGTILLIFNFLKSPFVYLSNSKQRNNILYLICCFSPVIIVILLKSVLYDGWRHLYFIYPSFILLAIYGLDFFIKKNKRGLVIVSSLVTFIFITGFMIENYPLQHVYFNYFLRFNPPEYVRKNFEMDYWGVSYRQSLEYILKNDDSPLININVPKYNNFNLKILTSKDRIRFNYVPFEEASYFITNYRWHPQDYEEIEKFKTHSIKIINNTVSAVFKIK